MRGLSRFLRWSPKLFYISAVMVMFLGIALPLHELSVYGYSASLPTDQSQFRVVFVQLIVREGINALFLLASGLSLEILIAIYDRISSPQAGGAE